LLLGSNVCSVDGLGRIQLSDSFLGFIKTGVVMTQGFERNLLVMTADSFNEIVRQIAAMSQTDPMVRLLSRILLSNAQEVQVSENKEFSIPEHLRKLCNLEQEAVVVGLGDYFEIWSQNAWEIQMNRIQDFDANANRFVSHNLVIH